MTQSLRHLVASSGGYKLFLKIFIDFYVFRYFVITDFIGVITK